MVAEKDYELALDALPHRHHQVVSLQARDANAEGAGQVSLADLVTHALRMNPSRIIVGEVRGEELLPMLTAMGSGNDGSLCTLHANSAHAAFNRMAAIGLAGSARLPVEATHLLAADAVDLVVHLALDDTPGVGRAPVRHAGAGGDRGRGERPGRLQRDLPARPGRPRRPGHPDRLPGRPGRRRAGPGVDHPVLVGHPTGQRAHPPRRAGERAVTALAALGGALAGLGVLLVVAGWTGRGLPERTGSVPRRSWRARLRRVPARGWRGWSAVPLLAWAVTGWPVAAVFALVVTAAVPRLLAERRAAAARIERLQGLADWTRRLADVLTAGAGLEQALVASLPGAPAPVAGDVARLVARLRARRPVEEALRAFGDDLADPTADLVVAALLLAATRRGRGLAKLLTGLAATVEEEVAMRRAVEADRATPRTTARWVAGITLAVTAALVLLDRAYVAPFATPAGQVALAVVAVLFAGAFWWMHRLSAPPAVGPVPARRGRQHP